MEAAPHPSAGSSSTTPSASGPIEAEVEPPYPLPRAPEAKLVCVGAPAPEPSYDKGVVLHIDLATMPLFPVAFGPRVSDLPVTSLPRSVATQARHVEAARDELRRCYRWARFAAPDLAGKLVAHYDISPFGDVEGVRIEDAARWGELGDCVREVLGARPYDSFTPRQTRATAEIVFARSGLGQPDERPARPSRTAPPARSGCVRAIAPLPVDELAWGDPKVKIDDFDAAQAALESERAACRAQPGPCRITRPTDGAGMVAIGVSRPTRTGASLREAVEENRGAFARCWLEAKSRGAVTAEEITLRTAILPDGGTRRTEMAKPSGDAAFDACLTAALAEIPFDGGPGLGLTVLHVSFRLFPVAPSVTPAPARDTPENVALLAQVALVAGDGDTGLRRFAALARNGRSCEVQLGMLRALLLARPWADAPALMAASDLIGLAPTGACRDESITPLIELVRRPFERARATQSPELYEDTLLRAQLALRLGDPRIDEAVRPFVEDALRHLDRDDDAASFRVR